MIFRNLYNIAICFAKHKGGCMDKKAIVIFSVLIIIGAVIATRFVLIGKENLSKNEEVTTLTIFHAGSLSGPFDELEKDYEDKYDNIDVQRESAGSADTIRKVTDLGKVADVVGSADYTLIQSMMIDNEPPYAEWYIQFAVNRLVIAYTDKSSANNEITADNWPEIFARDNVNFGFSNPNADPCGYRALMLIQLAEKYYNQSNLFDDLVESHSSIKVVQDQENFTINAPENLDPDKSIMIRPKETDLMAQLEAGELDYLIIYRSVAYQHRDSHVKFLELPKEIDLSDAALAYYYGNVSLQQYSDLEDKGEGKGKLIKAKPIVYGITIPSNAEHNKEAEDFVKLLLGTVGQAILNDLGQPPIVPARASDISKIPDTLKEFVIQE